MSNEAKTTKTSGSTDSVLRLTKRCMKPKTTKVALSNTSRPKYKGVVQQPNGHWGAQIYPNDPKHPKGQRVWIGTFKTAVAEAAKAYDIASIMFNVNPHLNFPLSEFAINQHKRFQHTHQTTKEDVLNMIRDGSYHHKFRDFLASQEVQGGEEGVEDEGSDKFFSSTRLFEKELTASDVGKLNRLVIPKKYAVKYFPEIGGALEDVEVSFLDKTGRQWKFRYCYWKSSQSFVFTRGWSGFVKEKKLKEKDKVVIYTCNRKTLQGQIEMFSMIDVQKHSGNGFVGPDQVKNHVHENVFSSKLEVEETKTEENKGGFMLFGVRIQ